MLNGITLDPTLRRQLIEAYMRQQMAAAAAASSAPAEAPPLDSQSGAIIMRSATPDALQLQEFKAKVRGWLEADNAIKKLKSNIRELQKHQKELTAGITKFMTNFNIEDLDTREGRLRCRITNVRQPVSRKQVQQRLAEFFDGDTHASSDAYEKIFGSQNTVEKVSLRRLRIT
jgi:hypothetical protein